MRNGFFKGKIILWIQTCNRLIDLRYKLLNLYKVNKFDKYSEYNIYDFSSLTY